jgi:very-short-patch-repair endonuclease
LRREQALAEKALWAALRELKDNWRRQVPIGPYVADFAHHRCRLIIEVDGYYHTLPETTERDAVRTAWLTAEGYNLVRFPEKTVRDDLYTVIDQIRALAPTPTVNPVCPAQMGV